MSHERPFLLLGEEGGEIFEGRTLRKLDMGRTVENVERSSKEM